MTLWLIIAFSFFGKNPINILPIIFGGFLFSKFVGEPFSDNVLPVLLSTALSPAVSQIVIINADSYMGIFYGLLIGICIGFVIGPIAKSAIKAHDGFNLYNSGFAAGILAMLIMAIFKNYGADFEPVYIVSSGNDFLITLFVVILSLFLIAVGFACSDNPSAEIRNIFDRNWITNDFYAQIKESSYINMGILGLFTIIFLNIYGVSMSGPIIGGVFTIIGFGCYGKSIKNIVPIMIGAIFASLLSIHEYNGTLPVITILFSTCLAPIAERFGFGYGMLAGYLHFNLALNIGIVHGGLNLYNNGLAGGVVAMLLVPIINSIKKRNITKDEEMNFITEAKQETDLNAE